MENYQQLEKTLYINSYRKRVKANADATLMDIKRFPYDDTDCSFRRIGSINAAGSGALIQFANNNQTLPLLGYLTKQVFEHASFGEKNNFVIQLLAKLNQLSLPKESLFVFLIHLLPVGKKIGFLSPYFHLITDTHLPTIITALDSADYKAFFDHYIKQITTIDQLKRLSNSTIEIKKAYYHAYHQPFKLLALIKQKSAIITSFVGLNDIIYQIMGGSTLTMTDLQDISKIIELHIDKITDAWHLRRVILSFDKPYQLFFMVKLFEKKILQLDNEQIECLIEKIFNNPMEKLLLRQALRSASIIDNNHAIFTWLSPSETTEIHESAICVDNPEFKQQKLWFIQDNAHIICDRYELAETLEYLDDNQLCKKLNQNQ